ncbi:hypothetical protein C0995_003309 [Termitomyces sp. Mi166|nr:hypothetical protein C0995_003309 [Termitomyces sp. Mi166\
MMTPGHSDILPEPTSETTLLKEQIASIALAIKTELIEQFKASIKELHDGMDVIYAHIVQLEHKAQKHLKMRRGPKINLPEVYNGKSKPLVDQFI